MRKIRKSCIIVVMYISCMLMCSCGNQQDKSTDLREENETGQSAAQEMVKSGTTEDGVTYQYDTKTKTLTMSGKIIKGAYPDDYSKAIDGEVEKRPWEEWSEEVKEIVLTEGVECVSNEAFANFRKLEKITFPKTMKKIGRYAFFEAGKIEKLVLPDSVEEIGHCAFALNNTSRFRGIDEIELPKELRKIGSLAFSSQNFSSITIPENVESIEEEAFEECIRLKTVIIKSEKIKEVGGTIFLHANKNITVYVPKNKVKEYKEWLWEAKAVRPLKE